MTVNELPRVGVADALVRVMHQVQRVFTEVSRASDLTPQQAQLLCRLAPGPMGMTDLSRALNLEKSSLSGLVDRIERRGLVRRVRHDHDRRALSLELSPDGAALAAGVHHAVAGRLDALIDRLPDGDGPALAAVLARLLAVGDD